MVTTTTTRLPHPLWASKLTSFLWLAELVARIGLIACIVLMLTAMAQVIGDLHAPHTDVPRGPAHTVGLMFLGMIGCGILSVVMRRELRFRSPGALIEAPDLQPVSWPRILRVLALSVFTLWLISTQLPLNLPLVTALWMGQGITLMLLGVAELIRDSILDRQHWIMNMIFGVKNIVEGLVLVLLSRRQHIDAGLLETLVIFFVIAGVFTLIPRTVSMIRARRGTKPSRFSPMGTVDEASEDLMQLVVDRYDTGATLKTREQWRRWIRIALVGLAVVLIGTFIISLYTY